MRKVAGCLLGMIGMVVVACLGIGLAADGGDGPLSVLAKDAQLAATNAALDASGVKGRLNDALEAHADDIAQATGMSPEQVNAAITDLDVESWEAARLPESATPTGSVDGGALGIDGTLTTYDDPGYVTVDAFGQNVTLAVPDSAQSYTSYLAYL